MESDLASSLENSGVTINSEDLKDEICISDLYALLQTSISSIDESPHSSLDTLTLLMEQICSKQEAIQASSPLSERLEFWKQVNGTWLFVVESAFKAKTLKLDDWKIVCETVIAVGDVLSLYGLVDYPLGFAEETIIEVICNNLPELY